MTQCIFFSIRMPGYPQDFDAGQNALLNKRSAGKEWNRLDGYKPRRPLDRTSVSGRQRKQPDVTIPWTTALYLLKKLMPVVIDKAPGLLKSLERRRTAPSQADNDIAEPSLAMLQERLHVHVQTLATQMETIEKLEATARATRRSLRIVWAILVATVILCVSIFVLLLSRS